MGSCHGPPPLRINTEPVSRKTIAEARRLMESAGETVDVQLSPQKVRFEFGQAALTSKVIDGAFPDYLRVIPRGNDKQADIDNAIIKVERAKTELGYNRIQAPMDGTVVSIVTRQGQADHRCGLPQTLEVPWQQEHAAVERLHRFEHTFGDRVPVIEDRHVRVDSVDNGAMRRVRGSRTWCRHRAGG